MEMGCLSGRDVPHRSYRVLSDDRNSRRRGFRSQRGRCAANCHYDADLAPYKFGRQVGELTWLPPAILDRDIPTCKKSNLRQLLDHVIGDGQ
jgi:hypothetical protein